MKNIITIVKKELFRFFTDKRMLISLILPGFLIFIVYSLIGPAISNMSNVDSEYEYHIKVFNANNAFDFFKIAQGQYIVKIDEYSDETNLEEAKKQLHDNENLDLIIEYSKNFDLNNKTSSISLYYNSTSKESSTIYAFYYAYIFNESKVIESLFQVNENLNIKYDVATDEDTSSQFVSILLPFLLLTFLFSSCLSVSTESIAGEKERGTIATLLITPVKRSEIAIGKIIALGITSIVSAITSFIGLSASLPKMATSINFDFSMYHFEHFIALFALILVIVFLFITLLSIVSAFSKSVKEASAYSVPVMILVEVLGMTSMFSLGEVQENLIMYLIPIYNATQCMKSILMLKFDLLPFVFTIISNLLFCGLGIFVLIKMFNSEKIMFNK